jgi:hypothetical protein
MGVITIGAKDFVRGVSTSDNLSDGGYSPKSKGQNLLANIGCLNPIPTYTDRSTNVINNIIAINPSNTNLSGSYDAIMVSQREPTGGTPETPSYGASFYTWNAGTATLRDTDANGDSKNRVFLAKYTDIIRFNGDVYVSSNNDVSFLGGSDMTTSNDYDWFSTTRDTPGALSTNAWHRLLVWDKKLWITDGSYLHYFDGTDIVEKGLDLSGIELHNITAIGNYEASGDMIIATAPNITDGHNQQSKILIWDGNETTAVNRETHVMGMITAFFNHGGVTYVFYNNMFGYFNGNGITPLRRLNIEQSATALDSQYIFPSKVTSINDTIYIAEDEDILAYGKLYPRGNRVFYYPFKEGNQIHSIMGFADDKLAVASGTTGDPFTIDFGEITVTDSSTKSSWVSNVYDLPSNSRIDKIEILFETALVASDRIDVSIYPSSDPNAATTPANGSITYTALGAISEYTIRGIDVETASLQLFVQWVAGSTSIRQIKVYYDAIEKPV